MSDRFRPVDRETLFLLPPSMEDWLPDNHLDRFVVDIVGQLDLTAIKSSYAGRGSKAHHPEMLLTPLFVQLLLIAQQMGCLKPGKVNLDGTKIKANASKHRALSWKHACKLEKQLKAEVDDLLRQAEEADRSEKA